MKELKSYSLILNTIGPAPPDFCSGVIVQKLKSSDNSFDLKGIMLRALDMQKLEFGNKLKSRKGSTTLPSLHISFQKQLRHGNQH